MRAGHLVTGYDGFVSVELESNPGGSKLGGNSTALVADGVATFSGLTLNKPGSGYTLGVSGGGLAPVNTAEFNVSPASTQSQGSTSTSSPTQPPTGSPTSTSSPAAAPAPRAAPAVFVTQTSLRTKSKAVNFGQPVTLTAVVKIKGTTGLAPGGSVTFTDARGILATVELKGGKASITTVSLPLGKNGIRADYNGAANAEPSRSAVVIETIRGVKSKTKLTSSANPARLGQTVTLTASVSGVGARPAAPSGTVTFVDGATILGSIMLEGGRATITTDRLSGGTHRIKADYSGNALYNPSSSKVLKQEVRQSVAAAARYSSFKRRFQRVQADRGTSWFVP